MRVRFWGVRGSIPVPGRTTSRYGGNTSCVEVRPRDAAPIIIDAGTGLRRLGKALMEESFRDGRGEASILISHTHWDHVQGLPFFSPLYRAGNRIRIFARHRDTHLEAVFSQQHGAPYFPVPLSAMQAEMSFTAERGEADSAGRSHSTRLNHPWIALAYRSRSTKRSSCTVRHRARPPSSCSARVTRHPRSRGRSAGARGRAHPAARRGALARAPTF
jgi:phosphoribosyl 1,2-cyclic phosphodiesterase